MKKIPQLKRFIRLMDKNDNSYKLSFLFSSEKIIILNLNKEEFNIFTLINGVNSTREIAKTLNITIKSIEKFLKKLEREKMIDYLDVPYIKNDNIFDRHDLFFDMFFLKKKYTKNNISKKTILLVGIGGIGNNIIILLLRMGFRKFILIDNDKIKKSNLTRQFLFDKNDVGKLKTKVAKDKMLFFDDGISINTFNKKFTNNIYNDLENIQIHFAFLSAYTPQTIAIDAYNIFNKLFIPYTTVGYLNDFAMFGPIIDGENKLFEKFIFNHKKDSKNKILKEVNSRFQSPSFGPINMFSSCNAVFEMLKYFEYKNTALSYNKKIIFKMKDLSKIEIDFKNNNKIGIFNSSSGISEKFPERVELTKNFLESKGLNIKFGILTGISDNYRSGNIKDRSNEFNSLLKECDVMMSMIGGYNSSSILPFIDYKKIKDKKIKIVGYSDTTAILLAVYKKTGISTYYGSAFLPSFSEEEYIKNYNFESFNKYVLEDLKGIIPTPKLWTEEMIDWSNSNSEKYKKKLNKNKLVSFHDGIVTGRLIGGNLNTIVSIFGTEYMPDINNGDILFIEDSWKKADETERNFAFLKNSGILNLVSGIIVGKSENYNDLGSGKKYYELLLEFMDRNIPILAEYDCGHTMPSNILKIGGIIELNTFKKEIKIIY